MISAIINVANGRLYWAIVSVLSLGMLVAALFYQYQLEFEPCVLCIEVRIWVIAILLTAVAGLFAKGHPFMTTAIHLVATGLFAALLDRSWQLFGTEKGFIFADCGFSLGLPAWFALDQWFPGLFEVRASCGYTPELLFGITMAEALLVVSAGLLVTGILCIIAQFLSRCESA